MEISEAREVRVRQGDARFVFLADHATGRLAVREESDDGDEVCAITVGDRDELNAFLTGLRRVLGVDNGAGPVAAPASHREASESPRTVGSGKAGTRRDAGGEEDRQAAIERARERNPHAFQPWSREEEQRLAAAFKGGAGVDQLARDHARSRRAIEMRLERLGLR